MKTAEHLLRALTRAMLANPSLEPTISFEPRKGGGFLVELDVRPFDPAPMIGSGGAMKFAIQTMLAGNLHPGNVELVFRNNGKVASPRLRGIAPQVEPMRSAFDAAVQHWLKMLGVRTADVTVETSARAAIAIFTLDESLSYAQRGAVSRIARAIGKANGYLGTCIVEKPALAG